MRNIYNKGKYRSGEWAKHLRPVLKKAGNRRWRKSAALSIAAEIACAPAKGKKPVRAKKNLVLRLKLKSHGDKVHTVQVKYRSVRAMQDSLRINQVLSAMLMNDKPVIILKTPPAHETVHRS
jgi:hypothetical protein